MKVQSSDWSSRLIPTPTDPYDEWMCSPLGEYCEDPRFEVRRARPEDFERIYDTVDAAFGKKRPRAVYDWLYRKNPCGIARCWLTFERATGELVKTGASYPWPVWRGDEALMGALGGDAATLPHWQRKGLSHLRRMVRRAHPWYGKVVSFAGPNESSRIVMQKSGQSEKLMGSLRGAVLVLRANAPLRRIGIPAVVSRPVSMALDALTSVWHKSAEWGIDTSQDRVEDVSRFDTEFDAITIRTMSWPKYWSPHNADFLNWRYLDHPAESYQGLALVENERPTGYAVLRLAGESATLSEFAVEANSKARIMSLLSRAIAVAREANCSYVSFFATPSWRHWQSFYRAGFVPYPTDNHFEASCKRFEPEIFDIRNWQVMPGDRDYH